MLPLHHTSIFLPISRGRNAFSDSYRLFEATRSPIHPLGLRTEKNLTCYPYSLGYFLDYNLTPLWSLNVHIGERTGKLWFRRESNPHGHCCPRDFERGFGFEPNSVPHYLVFGRESRKSPLCLPFHHWTFLSYTTNIQKRINKSNRNVSRSQNKYRNEYKLFNLQLKKNDNENKLLNCFFLQRKKISCRVKVGGY